MISLQTESHPKRGGAYYHCDRWKDQLLMIYTLQSVTIPTATETGITVSIALLVCS